MREVRFLSEPDQNLINLRGKEECVARGTVPVPILLQLSPIFFVKTPELTHTHRYSHFSLKSRTRFCRASWGSKTGPKMNFYGRI